MTCIRVKRSNFALGLLSVIYIFSFCAILLNNVEKENLTDNVQGFAATRYFNDSTLTNGKQCNLSSLDYRDELRRMFDVLKDEPESHSSCKILMDESTVLRALEYGPPRNADSLLRRTDGPENKTSRTAPAAGSPPQPCQPLGYSSVKLPVTALASFPGSGNTWVRHLLQQATGIYTGSVYKDGSLKKQFPGEGKMDGSVIAVKLHETNKIDNGFFERAIVIIRNPFDAIKAEFTRRKGTGHHTGKITIDKFKKRAWPDFVQKSAWDWFYSTIRWLSYPGHLHIVRYEKLKTNLRHEVAKMVTFLDLKASDEILDCVVKNSEGSFHRKANALSIDPYDFIDRETVDLIDTFSAAIESTIIMRIEHELPR